MDQGKTRVYRLSYPDPLARAVTMRIYVNQLNDAKTGYADAQNAICARYKMAADLPRDFMVSWEVLRPHIELTKDRYDDKEKRRQWNKQINALRSHG